MTAPWHLRKAVDALRSGGLIAYPTEAVWGLGCDPQNERASLRLIGIKRRDWRKGLILIAADFKQVEPYLHDPSRSALKRAQATWPGPTTWVFAASDYCPVWISGDQDSVAVRVTAHPIARALCQAFGGAIVSTSANRAGRDPALSATAARLAFGDELAALVPGPTGGRDRPSTIRHSASGLLLRR
jgi:L-threonylcarbamoyladenylate synthase